MPERLSHRNGALPTRNRRDLDTFAAVVAVYTYITVSRRTQITLTDRQHAFLRDEASRTGLSMGELVRRAIDSSYRPFSRPRVGGVELSVGLWRAPDAAVVGRRVRPL